MPGDWTPEPFEADEGTIPFHRFIDDLSDFKFAALDTAIDRVRSVRGIDLIRTEWLKALGEGLHEVRVRNQPHRACVDEPGSSHALAHHRSARCGRPNGGPRFVEGDSARRTARTTHAVEGSSTRYRNLRRAFHHSAAIRRTVSVGR